MTMRYRCSRASPCPSLINGGLNDDEACHPEPVHFQHRAVEKHDLSHRCRGAAAIHVDWRPAHRAARRQARCATTPLASAATPTSLAGDLLAPRRRARWQPARCGTRRQGRGKMRTSQHFRAVAPADHPVGAGRRRWVWKKRDGPRDGVQCSWRALVKGAGAAGRGDGRMEASGARFGGIAKRTPGSGLGRRCANTAARAAALRAAAGAAEQQGVSSQGVSARRRARWRASHANPSQSTKVDIWRSGRPATEGARLLDSSRVGRYILRNVEKSMRDPGAYRSAGQAQLLPFCRPCASLPDQNQESRAVKQLFQ